MHTRAATSAGIAKRDAPRDPRARVLLFAPVLLPAGTGRPAARTHQHANPRLPKPLCAPHEAATHPAAPMKTFIEELQDEAERARRRHIHLTRVQGRVLTMEEAAAVCADIDKKERPRC